MEMEMKVKGDPIEFIKQCSSHTLASLFPSDIKNWKLVYFINILHIIGVFYIQFGLLSSPAWMKYYIIYLVFLLMFYILLNNKCFMTIISNYFSERNYNMLCIKLENAKLFIIGYLALAVIFYSKPELSPFSILSKIFSK
jgi:hypothetical protein